MARASKLAQNAGVRPATQKGASFPAGVPSPAPEGRRLDSWKEIAVYLGRHMTTVRRWERTEGLPVHRHRHAALGSVYAFSRELDQWRTTRRAGAERPQPGSAGASTRLPPSPVVAQLASTSIPLIGREAEFAALAACWEGARGGAARLVVVTGDAGIGKTRLLADFAERAADGATVLAGRCDREALVPFAPFVEILQWIVRACPAAPLERALANIEGGADLVQLVPEIGRHVRTRPQPIGTTPDGHRYRMFEAYAALLRELSVAAPVFVLLDDLHWADRGTVLLMRHLIRSLPDARLCVAVTYCDAEVLQDRWLEDIVSECRREPSATSVGLQALPPSAIRAFVAAWTGSRPSGQLVERFSQHTHGNPFFMIEYLRHLAERGTFEQLESFPEPGNPAPVPLPAGVRDLVTRRLAALSESSRQLLTLAAVIGREFDLSTLEAASDRPEHEVLEMVDAALKAHLAHEIPGSAGRLGFAHTLIREALYQRVSAARRVRLHHRVAEAIERGPIRGRAPLAELAYHFCLAAPFRDGRKAVEYSIRAGEQAEAHLALDEASRCFGMALDALQHVASPGGDPASERSRLLERRGRSSFKAGQWAAARADFELALAQLDEGDTRRRCELLVRLAETAFWLMDVPGLRKYAAEAERLSERMGRRELWAEARAWLSSADVADGNVLHAVESDRRTLTQAGGIRSFGLARVPLTLYWVGQTAEAVQRSAEAVQRARNAGDPAFLLYALQHRGLSLSGAGRYDESIEVFDEARTFGRRCGALPLLARATSMSVAPLLSLGDFEAATLRALEARELAHRVAFEAPIVSAGIDLLLIAARSGDPARSESLLPEITEAVDRAAGWHAWKWRMRLSQARAELALARGDTHEAIIASSQVIDQSRARHRPKYEALALQVRAQARARTAGDDARRDARQAVEVARAMGDPALLVECLTGLMALAGNAAAEELRDAVRRVLDGLRREPLRSRFLAGLALRTGGSGSRVTWSP